MQGDLMCSSCGLIKDEELIEDCQKCCTHAVKYRSAILEVCPMKLSERYDAQSVCQHAQKSCSPSGKRRGGNRTASARAFLEDSAHKYQRLKVRTPLNASPRLRLTQEDGSSDSIRVDLWKKTALEDFFSARMLPS
eukprot:1152817-Pelagomonas_calceolata.AAC.2